jgi:L-seryl-tRNA(Ser) seleniumtransferase
LETLASAFRSLPIPVIGHIKHGALILDLRCLDDETSFVSQLALLPPYLATSKVRDVSA